MTDDTIRFWTRAAAAVTIVNLILAIVFPSYASLGYEPFPPGDPIWLLVIVASVAMAVGLLCRSRVVAAIALVGAGALPFARWFWADLWPWTVADIATLAIYVRALDATLAHHAAKAAPSRLSANVRRTLQTGGAVVIIGLMWMCGAMPPPQVVSGDQLPRAYRRALDGSGLIADDERVRYVSSDAVFRVSSAMYVLTDRRLVLHNTSWSPATHRIELSAIADVWFHATESRWENSYLTVALDDETILTFALPAIGGGDVRFRDALMEAWRQHRPADGDGTFALRESATSREMPAALAAALRGIPGARLLDPESDLVGDYTTDDLREAGYWPPWIQRDLNRDGRDDIAAVVVRTSGTDRQFAVVVVHSDDGRDLSWAVPFQQQRVYSVAAPRSAALNVLLCVHCDWDFWVRWNGTSYEDGLYAVGENVVVADGDRDVPAPLFDGPSETSGLVATVPGCAEGTVRQVSGHPDSRWYEIDVPTITRRVWIPARMTDVNPCMG